MRTLKNAEINHPATWVPLNAELSPVHWAPPSVNIPQWFVAASSVTSRTKKCFQKHMRVHFMHLFNRKSAVWLWLQLFLFLYDLLPLALPRSCSYSFLELSLVQLSTFDFSAIAIIAFTPVILVFLLITKLCIIVHFVLNHSLCNFPKINFLSF